MGIDAIPDDLLEVIILQADSTIFWLLRAASICKQWRRIVAGRAFLHRFRSIHGPPIAGTYYNSPGWTCPADFVPLPSSGVDGRYFSLDYLPDSISSSVAWPWIVSDTRAGFVLLKRRDWGFGSQMDFVICEPLSQRYRIILPQHKETDDQYNVIEAFLLDGQSAIADGIGLSNFRIICVAVVGSSCTYQAGVFTSDDSSWRTIRIHGQSVFRSFHLMGHSKGSIYWWVEDHRMVVVVDRKTAELTPSVLPEVDGLDRYYKTVTTGRDGEVRIVLGGPYGFDLKVFARQALDSGWVLEKSIRLPAATLSQGQYTYCSWWFMLAPDSGHGAGTVSIYSTSPDSLLTLDLDSETIETETEHAPQLGCPFELPWPPAFRACT